MPDRQLFATPGERYYVQLPHSEVCIHLRVAGRILPVEFLDNAMVQIYDGNDKELSFPITAGEAGFHFSDFVGGWYCYGTHATNAPAECAMNNCVDSVCECGESIYCYRHTHG